jgi:hypothetical protein
MSIKNHSRVYRPLLGGVQIINGRLGEPGTLGMIVPSPSQDGHFLLTAGHVLAKGTPADHVGDLVYQPQASNDTHVAVVAQVSARLDCAAARLVETGFSLEILGIGKLAATAEPKEGMHVIKSGVATGVTEGRIDRVRGEEVTIRLLKGFPFEYELCEAGDSGAIWIDIESRAPVALHFAAQSGGEAVAFAIPLPAVLHELKLA